MGLRSQCCTHIGSPRDVRFLHRRPDYYSVRTDRFPDHLCLSAIYRIRERRYGTDYSDAHSVVDHCDVLHGFDLKTDVCFRSRVSSIRAARYVSYELIFEQQRTCLFTLDRQGLEETPSSIERNFRHDTLHDHNELHKRWLDCRLQRIPLRERRGANGYLHDLDWLRAVQETV